MDIDLTTATDIQRYKLLMSSVVPRPIALVTSIDAQGNINAAPFSCFNIMASTPGTVVLGIDENEPGIAKDTSRIIHETGEFVVNLVNMAIVEQMNQCSALLPAGQNELDHAGLSSVPGTQVRAPRIIEAPISMECTRTMALDIGNGRSIVIGHIVHYHIQDQFYDAEHGHVLADKVALVARMHGRTWYARTTDLFELERPHNEKG